MKHQIHASCSGRPKGKGTFSPCCVCCVILQQEYERLCTDMVNKLLTSQQKKMAQQQQQQQHAMHAQAQMLVQQQQPTVQSGMWREQVQATGTIFSDLEGLQATPLRLAMVCKFIPFLPSCCCWWRCVHMQLLEMCIVLYPFEFATMHM